MILLVIFPFIDSCVLKDSDLVRGLKIADMRGMRITCFHIPLEVRRVPFEDFHSSTNAALNCYQAVHVATAPISKRLRKATRSSPGIRLNVLEIQSRHCEIYGGVEFESWPLIPEVEFRHW
jgi:hypothetical protein